MIRLVLLWGLVAAILAAPSIHGGYGSLHQSPEYISSSYNGHDYYAPAYYNFGYGVHDPYHGTNFGHKESREGHVVKGEYYVSLPDGRLQKVSYYADEHGYHPTVTYVGKAHFPPPKHAHY